jgi:DNA-binding NarL/FixJ family response regulator
MKLTKHLLITGSGQSNLPRFIEAFPKATVIAFGDQSKELVDVVWLKLDPLEQARAQVDWLKKYYPNQKFVVMSNIPMANEAFSCLRAGAKAYVNTHAGPETLKQIEAVVLEGGIWLGEDLMQLFIVALGKTQSAESDLNEQDWKDKLSQREIEVVEAVTLGMSNKLVARQLDITERTVKAHLTAIYEKLGVGDRLKLVLLVKGQL